MSPVLSRRCVIPLLVMTAGAATVSRAQELADADVEIRTLLLFRASDTAVQALLPPDWHPNPLPNGPGRGANLNLTLVDRWLSQDAEGRVIANSTNPGVILAVPARNSATGQSGTMIAAVFAAAGTLPEAGMIGVEAEISARRSSEAAAGRPRHVQEQWSLSGTDGSRLDVRLGYQGGAPVRVSQEQRIYAARRPDLVRLYRVDQGVDALRGAGIADRIDDWAFTAKGPVFQTLFDGSERLAAVFALPWYVRRGTER